MIGVAQKTLAFASLVKPRITLMVVVTAIPGFFLADAAAPTSRLLLLVAGMVLVIGGANALNMYLERDSDALMRRTMKRPIPGGRLSATTALCFGLALGALSLPVLALGFNLLTALLGAFALFAYVLVYTPMKRRSSVALLVGAVPGAIPPLMGWTAATGRLDLPGAVLFFIMFLWQVPHFLAITLYASEDFARGGIRVMPLVEGVPAAKRQIVAYLAALFPTTLLLVPCHVAGTPYLVAALVGGAVFCGFGLYGLRADAGVRWARSLFLVSLVYLTVLFVTLAVEGRA